MRMKIFLTKKLRKNTAFVSLETEETGMTVKTGTIGKPSVTSFWQDCISSEGALEALDDMIKKYSAEGYIKSEQAAPIDTEAFDKAKWHFGGDYPSELDDYQAYVHTGIYVGWLIMNNLASEELISNCNEGILLLKGRKISPAAFYRDYMDGVFTTDDVNVLGYSFTKEYFDFNAGSYLKDYEAALAINFPSLYHVEDTWENFGTMCRVIDKRFEKFRRDRKS
jgi:hypothetical protein